MAAMYVYVCVFACAAGAAGAAGHQDRVLASPTRIAELVPDSNVHDMISGTDAHWLDAMPHPLRVNMRDAVHTGFIATADQELGLTQVSVKK